MAVNKTKQFGDSEIELSAFAKALSHPARIEILRVLAEKNACICGEIVEVLPLSQSTVSQHLKALKEAGLIDGTINGKSSCYCLNWNKLANSMKSIQEYFNALKEKANP